MTYVFDTNDDVVDVCLDSASSPTTKKFDIVCDETNISDILGTSVEDDFVVTWKATVSSPYNSDISNSMTNVAVKIKNPCADSSFATITGTNLSPQTYIVTSGDKSFAQPADIAINSPYDTVCGDLTFAVQYGSPLGLLAGTPLSYASASGDFTVNTSLESLIGEVVPYRLSVVFADYQGASASAYDS